MYDVENELNIKASQYVETNGQYEFESKSWSIPLASQEETDNHFNKNVSEEDLSETNLPGILAKINL